MSEYTARRIEQAIVARYLYQLRCRLFRRLRAKLEADAYR